MAGEVRTSSDVIRALRERGQDPSGLSPIGVRPPLGTYLRELWERRHFIWYDSRQRASTQNTSTRLGNLWLFLRPLIDAAFYWLIFGVIIGADRGVANYPAYVIIGVLMFRSTSHALSSGATLMRGSKSMIRAFSFPRAAVPISSVLQSTMTSVITMLVICLAISVIPPFAPPQLIWPLIIPIFVMQALLNLGITFITARIGFHLPDMANVLSVVSRFLMYGSGVIFPIEAFIKDPTIREIVMLNPVFQVLDMSRTVLIDGAVPALDSWLILGAWVLVLLVGGFIYFSRGEEIYGRELR